MKFQQRVILMLLDDRVRFLTIAGMLFILLMSGILLDKTKDAVLCISMLANLAFGIQAAKQTKE